MPKLNNFQIITKYRSFKNKLEKQKPEEKNKTK